MEELDAKRQSKEIIEEALNGAFDILNLQSRDAKDAENIVKRLADGIISIAMRSQELKQYVQEKYFQLMKL